MKVFLVGAGCERNMLGTESIEAIESAQVVIGAPRVLSMFPEMPADKKVELYKASEIVAVLKEKRSDRACVVFSGDSGFYSGSANIIPLLEENDIEYTVIPGISSVQMLSAKIKKPWQDWKLCSAHGVECDIIAQIMSGKPCFFLTGGVGTPDTICATLTDAGLGNLEVFTGENLGYENEKIRKGTAAEFSKMKFSPLSVLLTDCPPVPSVYVPGIPDGEFIRGNVPMTKREVRALIPSLMELTPDDICWDIGSGTGSVGVELSLHSRGVWAVEKNPEALELMRLNREKFCAWNMHIVKAEAPAGMETMPAPDAVFIGGSGGALESILDSAFSRNPGVRICISAITIETLSDAVRLLGKRGCSCDVTQLSVSRARNAGDYHMLMAQNPTFLICGKKL